MENTYHLAADGGGSKLQAVLYDGQFRILRTGRVAGVNTLFKPVETVRADIHAMVSELLAGEVPSLASVDLCMVGAGNLMREALESHCEVKELHFHAEPVVGLAAALRTEGAVALSGTGSDAFFVKDGVTRLSVGGWGALLGDEGSGYDIGLRTLKAAIYAYDGRGEPTLLLDMVMEKWGFDRLWDMVGYLSGNPNSRHEIASAARLTARAAAEGDRVAIRIYEQAALEMVHQTRTVIDRHRAEWDGTTVTMGGAWKGSNVMFRIFKQELELLYPEARVRGPLYEPVVGCVVRRCLRDGMPMEEIETRLKDNFSSFLC